MKTLLALTLISALVLIVKGAHSDESLPLLNYIRPMTYTQSSNVDAISMPVVSIVVGTIVKQSLRAKYKVKSKLITKTILEESIALGLDPLLLTAMIQHESKFKVKAVGRHGEIGLMQILPKTAMWISKKAGRPPLKVNDLYDPVINIKVGALYLSWLKRKYPNMRNAISAYNMGSRNVKRFLAKDIVPKIYYSKVLDQYNRILSLALFYKTPDKDSWHLYSLND